MWSSAHHRVKWATWKRTSWPSESSRVVAEINRVTHRERERDWDAEVESASESAWRVVPCGVSGTVPDSKFLRVGFDQTAWSPDWVRLLSGVLGTICLVQWLASKLHVFRMKVLFKNNPNWEKLSLSFLMDRIRNSLNKLILNYISILFNLYFYYHILRIINSLLKILYYM